MIVLIYGGSGSGKSEYAEATLLSLPGAEQRYYVATMIPHGEEGKRCVERHVRQRAGKNFHTIECPTDLSKACDQIPAPEKAAVLIECVSNLTANEMFENQLDEEQTACKVTEEIRRMCSHVKHTVIVSNNIFEDGVEYDSMTTAYAAALGAVNVKLAELADKVYEVVVGIPVQIGEKK